MAKEGNNLAMRDLKEYGAFLLSTEQEKASYKEALRQNTSMSIMASCRLYSTEAKGIYVAKNGNVGTSKSPTYGLIVNP